MNMKDYVELPRVLKEDYVEHTSTETLKADLNDLIQIISRHTTISYLVECDRIGLTIMLKEISKRLEDAEKFKIGKNIIKDGFDIENNSTGDFLEAIDQMYRWQKQKERLEL